MTTLKQGRKFLELLDCLSTEKAQEVLGSGLLQYFFKSPDVKNIDRLIFAEACGYVSVLRFPNVVVDETKNIYATLRKVGVTSNNPIFYEVDEIAPSVNPKLQKKDMLLISFRKDVGISKIISDIDKFGYEKGTVWDAVSLISKRTEDLPKDFSIFVLGSKNKSNQVLSLGGGIFCDNGDEFTARFISLPNFGYSSLIHFVLVKKQN